MISAYDKAISTMMHAVIAKTFPVCNTCHEWLSCPDQIKTHQGVADLPPFWRALEVGFKGLNIEIHTISDELSRCELDIRRFLETRSHEESKVRYVGIYLRSAALGDPSLIKAGAYNNDHLLPLLLDC